MRLLLACCLFSSVLMTRSVKGETDQDTIDKWSKHESGSSTSDSQTICTKRMRNSNLIACSMCFIQKPNENLRKINPSEFHNVKISTQAKITFFCKSKKVEDTLKQNKCNPTAASCKGVYVYPAVVSGIFERKGDIEEDWKTVIVEMFCNQLSEHAFVAMVVDTKMKKVIEDIDRIEPIVDFIRPFNNTKKIPGFQEAYKRLNEKRPNESSQVESKFLTICFLIVPLLIEKIMAL